MSKGFPNESGSWRVYAKVPASRTNSASSDVYELDMVPQGTKTPDYSVEVISGEYNSAVFIRGNDIVDFYNCYELINYKTNVVGYIIFTDDNEVYDVRIARDGEEPNFEYALRVELPAMMEYQGPAKLHLVSAVSNDVDLHSADLTFVGHWNTYE